MGNGALTQVGRIGGLGKGERVYAVRFVGNTGYVVTFRQIDPLYTVDLTDPAQPRVLGELKISGYSAYLHPIGEDLHARHRPGGRRGRSPARDADLDLRRLRPEEPEAAARARRSARAGPRPSPTTTRSSSGRRPASSSSRSSSRPPRFRVGRAKGVVDLGRIDNGAGSLTWTPPIRRSLVVGGSVLTVSDAGVRSSDLDTLAPQGWVSFPPPAPPSGVVVEG